MAGVCWLPPSRRLKAILPLCKRRRRDPMRKGGNGFDRLPTRAHIYRQSRAGTDRRRSSSFLKRSKSQRSATWFTPALSIPNSGPFFRASAWRHCCHPAYSECPLDQLHYLTQLVRPGDIVLIDRCGDTRHACWGGIITTPLRAGNDPKPAQVRFCRPCLQRASDFTNLKNRRQRRQNLINYKTAGCGLTRR